MNFFGSLIQMKLMFLMSMKLAKLTMMLGWC